MKRGRKEYRMIPIIVYAVIAGFGLVMLYVGLTEFIAQRRALARAVPVRVQITASSVRESRSANTDRRLLRDNSTTSYTADVRFTYQFEGRLYESDMLRPTIIVGGGSRQGAQEEIAPFPVGARVDAWVDPQAPERAFLLREGFAGPIVFTVLGLFLPTVGWLASRLV